MKNLFCFLILLAYTLFSFYFGPCNPPPKQPKVDSTSVTIPDHYLDYGIGRRGVIIKERIYNLFAGNNADSFKISFDCSSLIPNTPLNFKDGNGTGLCTLTNCDVKQVTIPGNTGSIEINRLNNSDRPTVKIQNITVYKTINSQTVNFPELGENNRRSKSFRMSLNYPVALFFPPQDSSPRFLAITGLSGKRVDILIDGPAKVFISNKARGFVLSEELSWERLDNARGRLLYLGNVEPVLDTLFFTVYSQDTSAFLTLFSVNEIKDLIPLTIRFRGNAHDFNMQNKEELQNRIKEIVNYASLYIYNTTQRRVRFNELTVLLGSNTRRDLRADATVDKFSYGIYRSHVQFGQIIRFDKAWWDWPTDDGGRGLTHEFFHYRYDLPDEYDGIFNTSDYTHYCPSCCMSSFNSPYLCFPETHNPFGYIRGNLNESCWEKVASRLDIETPNKSTPEMFNRTKIKIQFPIDRYYFYE